MKELSLPIKGVSKIFPVDKEENLFSGYMINVRPQDVLERRIRLGKRPGLDKWGNGDQIGDVEQPIVAVCCVSSVS